MSERQHAVLEVIVTKLALVLLVLSFCWLGSTAVAAAELTADTSRPVHSTYLVGEKVELAFKVSGLDPKVATVQLLLKFRDENDQVIEERKLDCSPDAKGNFAATVTAPSHRLGFYRVDARLSTGETIAELGTRKQGYITYAVFPDPSSRHDVGEADTFYGLQGAFNPKWSGEIIPILGARWMLEGFGWDSVEPQYAGQFAESLKSGKISTAPRKPGTWRTYPLIILSPIPKWAAKPETYSYNTGALTADGEKAWVEFCKNAARVQMQRFPDLKQRIYQVTWEPVQPWGFKGTDAELIRIYELAYPALHEIDPDAVVAGPTRTLENAELENTIKMLQAGLGKYLDAVAIHPYYSADAEDTGYVDAIRRLRAGIDRYAHPGMPILGTEQGSPTKEVIAKEIIQANTLMRYNLISLGEGFQFNFSFYIHDFRTGGQLGQGFYYNLTPEFAWGPGKIGPKPVAPAYAAQTMLLEGHRPTRAIEWLGSTAMGYAFARHDHVVLALWDFGGTRAISLPVGSDEVTVFDMMGNSTAVKTNKGELQLKIGPDPIYVTGASSSLWGTSSNVKIATGKSEIVVCPGETAMLDGSVTSSGAEGSVGTLLASLAPELGGATLKCATTTAKSSGYQYEIPIPTSVAPGRYPVSLVLQNGSEAIAVSGAVIRVLEPVKVLSMEPQLDASGHRSIAMQLLNQTTQEAKGSVTIGIPAAAATPSSATFEIAPRETSRVTVDLVRPLSLDPLKRYSVESTIDLVNGMKVTKAASLNFLTAVSVAGDSLRPSDWETVEPIRLAGRASVMRGADQYYKNDEDLSAMFRCAWSDTALLLHVEVQDDQFCQPFQTTDLWRGDCLQIAVNLDPLQQRQKETGNRAADEAMPQRRHTEINIGLTREGPQAYRSHTFNPEKFPRAVISTAQLPVSVSRKGNVIIYDIALPWKTLGLEDQPKSNQLIGFAMAVNDADSNDQKEPKALGMFGGIHPAKNADKFGLMLLGPKAQK